MKNDGDGYSFMPRGDGTILVEMTMGHDTTVKLEFSREDLLELANRALSAAQLVRWNKGV